MSDSSQEKTELPTEKRKREAREKGQVAKSRELSATIVMMSGVTGLLMFSGALASSIQKIFEYNFGATRDVFFDPQKMAAHLSVSFQEMAFSLMPFLILLLFAVFVAPVLMGGILFSGKALAPKWNRLNPFKGIKRMFSVNALVELLKAVAKFVLVVAVGIFVIVSYKEKLIGLAAEPVIPAIAHTLQLLGQGFLILTSALIIIALFDVPFQIYQHNKSLKMSKQEVKDEYKNTEGTPEVKSRIRQIQREMAQRRMIAKVPEADVVITNPTHYAVAIKYDAERHDAPIVVAKGADLVAKRIRELAQEHQVVVVNAPPLARSIFYTTELEAQIPAGLYVAVAQVLTYVFHLRRYRQGFGARPESVTDFLIPDELKYE